MILQVGTLRFPWFDLPKNTHLSQDPQIHQHTWHMMPREGRYFQGHEASTGLTLLGIFLVAKVANVKSTSKGKSAGGENHY